MPAGPNIKIDYTAIQTVAAKLSDAQVYISPRILDLYNSVNALLAQDGGFWMQQSSPALWSEYQTFNASATGIVNAIASFSDMFTKLSAGLSDMDGKLAANILHPTGQ